MIDARDFDRDVPTVQFVWAKEISTAHSLPNPILRANLAAKPLAYILDQIQRTGKSGVFRVRDPETVGGMAHAVVVDQLVLKDNGRRYILVRDPSNATSRLVPWDDFVRYWDGTAVFWGE